MTGFFSGAPTGDEGTGWIVTIFDITVITICENGESGEESTVRDYSTGRGVPVHRYHGKITMSYPDW